MDVLISFLIGIGCALGWIVVGTLILCMVADMADYQIGLMDMFDDEIS